MKTIFRMALINEDKCIGCGLCAKVCPVAVIGKTKGSKRSFQVNQDSCSGCGFCVTQCTRNAVEVIKREHPVIVGISNVEVTDEIRNICLKAHMYPEQIVCFCHLIEAKEIAAAILKGAHTPEDISRVTGTRTGCGVLCISGVIRLLRAAGIEVEKAPGNQWYGMDVSIWDIPESVQKKYPEYFLADDLRIINKYFPQGGKK